MFLPDVNILLYAHRREAPGHARYKAWLIGLLRGDSAYGMSDLVLAGFLRVATHPRIFNPPSPMAAALAFVGEVTRPSPCVRIAPGDRHWAIFERLCRLPGVKGNTVPDAYLAALAIESGCEWVTTDRGFARFPGLLWRHPLDD